MKHIEPYGMHFLSEMEPHLNESIDMELKVNGIILIKIFRKMKSKEGDVRYSAGDNLRKK